MPKTTEQSLPEKITGFHKKYSKLPENSPVIIIQNRSAVLRHELATILRGMAEGQKIEVIDAENIGGVISKVRERVVAVLLDKSCSDTSIAPLSPHTARIVIGDLIDRRIKDQIDYSSPSLEPVHGEGSMLEDWLRVRIERSLEFAISNGLARRSELLELNRPKPAPEAKKTGKGRKKRGIVKSQTS